jgi:hypothetical protein
MNPLRLDNFTEFPSLVQPGTFVVGCNYWASHAGTAMWSDWRADIVEADLSQLASEGLQVLRVFPLWPDFQPLSLLRGGAGEPYEFRLAEAPLTDDACGRAGVSSAAADHFQEFADLAQKYGLKLMVGLVTGWMSGRLFVPPGLDGLNVLTDPVAIQWQVRLVRYLVHRFKDHPAITAWDLGNECNCMASVPNRQAAWLWASTITNAIRVEDNTRPVVSGMHSLLPGRAAPWTMQDQAEITDLLTTHPYPYFTPHCDQDPVNTLRTILHSTAESRFYADIGGKPCLVEEIGTLGPILASEAVAADFVRACLFSLWAHDCHGFLWWCAFDQLHLEQAPYDWAACERELGLFRKDRQAKPVLKAIKEFRLWLDGLPIQQLPPRQVDAVCIITEGQDQWAAAYSSFILAKQAGFELEFQHADQPLKPAQMYLVPSVSGMHSISRRRWLELLDAVQAGATLYLSHDDCLLSPFTEPFGLEVETRQRRAEQARFTIDGVKNSFQLQAGVRLNLKPERAQVLGREQDGAPVFTCSSYGLGKIYFLAVPLETALVNQPGAFLDPIENPYYKIYQAIWDSSSSGRVAHLNEPNVGLTEHLWDEHQRILVLIQYDPVKVQTHLHLLPGWEIEAVWKGQAHPDGQSVEVVIEANSACVLLIKHQDITLGLK